MTEAEWLSSRRAQGMLGFLTDAVNRERHDDRRFRVFACACLREVHEWLADRRSRQVVEVAERYADGQAARRKLEQAARAAGEAARAAYSAAQHGTATDAEYNLALAALELGADSGAKAAWGVCRLLGPLAAPFAVRDMAGLLREVFGNPFREPALPAGWRDWNEGTILRLARDAREEGRFDAMPVLGDALEEAGCVDDYLLAHCRAQGPHVAGCWVLHLLLGE